MTEKFPKKTGTLYGIGVGPGDPELITVKSARILHQVDVIFAASSTKNDYSLAVSIARHHIREETPVIMLPFPMTKDREEAQTAWKSNAAAIIESLEQGKNAAFITLGDSMTYSTYGYVLKYIQAAAPHIRIETIPGITSYQAAAARLNTPLVEGEESLLVMSGVKGGNRLREFCGKPENVVFLKAYRNVKDISLALEETGLSENSVAITHCGLPEEEIIRDLSQLNDKPPGYWTLIIAKRNKEV